MERSRKKKSYNNYNKNNNKKKEPIYYGIHLEIETEKKLLESLQNSIDLIMTEYKNDFNSTYETITELIKKYNQAKEDNEDNNGSNNIIEVNKMKYPKSFHITTAFGGKKGFNKNSKSVQEFSQGKEVEFKPLGSVIVPGKMVIIPVKPEFSVENEFPHFTTFIGDLRPVQSNEILENLFSKGMSLYDEYNNILDGKENEYIKTTKVVIDDEKFDAFVHLNGKNENLYGRMKGYYF